jgi:hypothetical protein
LGAYLTSEAVWLGLAGISAGSAAGLVWRAAGRTCWGAVPVLATVLVAAGLTGRFDRPRWSWMVTAGVIVITLAAAGTARVLADSAIPWAWVAAAALISAAGVWAGVPETGPALLAAGGLLGLFVTAGLTRAHLAPSAGVGMAAVLGWAALSGAVDRPWAALGGAMCTGAAPWVALHLPFPRLTGKQHRQWLLVAHAALVILAARWIGVDPRAGWGRVAVVAVAGGVVAVVYQRRA